MGLVIYLKSKDEPLTNNAGQIISIFRQNRMELDTTQNLHEPEVNRVVNDFFKDENTAKRLILFRDKICKSSTSIIKKTDDKEKIKKCCCSGCSCDKVKGEVPLYQFYINMSDDDKRINLVYKVHSKKDMLQLKEKDKDLLKFKEQQQQLHKEAEILEKHGKIYLE